jgi:cysteinyl-tRNA synthetase
VIAVGAWFRSHRADNSATSYANYVEQLAAQHRNTMAALQAAYRNTPALTTNWNDQLNGMERAADTVRKALRDDPDNIALLRMLNDVYQQEVDLLRRVHESPRNDQTI